MEDQKLYDKTSIESLDPRVFTRLHPQLYAGDCTYSTQLLIEVVANAVDEFRLGHGKKIKINFVGDKVTVIDESNLNEQNFEEILSENLEKDRVLTYTSRGIHKDDLRFEMNGNLIKKFGSQGQQKSFLIALKLAQIKRIKDITNKNPILLLDDIFD